MKHISIIGAGVAGLWTALLAHHAQFKVTLYEQQDDSLSQSCSHRAGGMLAFNCEADSKHDMITSLGFASLKLWQKFFPSLITQKGSLLLAHAYDKDQLRYFEKITTDFSILTQQEIYTLEPALEYRFQHGLYFYNEAHLEPRKCLKALLQACYDCGIDIHFNTKISNILSDTIHIDTRGLWSQDNLENLRGVKGEMIVIKCPDIELSRPIRLLHPHHPIYIVPRDNHHYMIGATTIETQNNQTDYVSVQSAGILLTQAFHVHPAFGEAEIIEMNCGYRPAFIDNKPHILQQNNMIYLNGLYRHGWTVAPAFAQKIIDLLNK